MSTTVSLESDGASLFSAEDRCPVQSDLGERETGGRQPSGRAEVRELAIGSVLRCILAPACKPCAVSLTSLLLAWSSQWEAVTSTWRAENQEKEGLFTLSATEGIFQLGLCLLRGCRSLCPLSFNPIASCRVSSTYQMGLLLIFVPVSLQTQRLPVPGWPHSPLLNFLVLPSSA